MIPYDRNTRNALAGEYVLGLLDPVETREIAAALATDPELRKAVAFWEEHLHPLSALATPTEPPPGLWNGIATRLDGAPPERHAPQWWNRPSPWRWATGGLAAVAAALLLYIVLSPLSPSYIALLRAPQHEQPSWVATIDRKGLTIRTVIAASPPPDRAFELWVIAPGSTSPQALGIIPKDGVLHVRALPSDVRLGATLAISVEPPGGSPAKRPTGPVVFVGGVTTM